MSVASPSRNVGGLLRDWRHRRRLSQLDLAVEADVSRPSRELVLHLAEHLDVPLRERNTLLLAAGYAPSYRQTSLDADDMAPVRDALDKVLTGHEPFPAIVVDRHWNLVASNRPAMSIIADGVAPELLTPPVNAMRVSLHPSGLAPRVANLPEYSAHLLERVHRQAVASGDAGLFALLEELRDYPGVARERVDSDPAALLFVPLVLRVGEGAELRFFSTLATFGTALDITVAELAIEAFFPADAATAAAVSAMR
jgi:transcriptional regulator with XRE-family HTH domain